METTTDQPAGDINQQYPLPHLHLRLEQSCRAVLTEEDTPGEYHYKLVKCQKHVQFDHVPVNNKDCSKAGIPIRRHTTPGINEDVGNHT
jgi:hypothetical protein